jgi:hypothetical protein
VTIGNAIAIAVWRPPPRKTFGPQVWRPNFGPARASRPGIC